jgi:hypothetical protein
VPPCECSVDLAMQRLSNAELEAACKVMRIVWLLKQDRLTAPVALADQESLNIQAATMGATISHAEDELRRRDSEFDFSGAPEEGEE